MKKHIMMIITISIIFIAAFASVQTVYADSTGSEPEGCIAFTSSEKFTVSLGDSYYGNRWDGIMQFSTDSIIWHNYTAGNEIKASRSINVLSGKYNVFFRGKGNSRLSTKYNDLAYKSRFILSGSDSISCSGNVENLLDHTTVREGGHPEMGSCAFAGLFYNCTSLTEAPELSSETLSEYCYDGMFIGCNNLTKAPELPVTTLANSCYAAMFSGCTSLTEAPDLPAETLANRCYADMFSGCTSLTEAPDLPAETLAEYCYNKMFSGCTSLTDAPELPAQTLAEYCYDYMFSGCTSLTAAPKLPAQTLSKACYMGMFKGCTSLTEAPELPAETLAEDCYICMFQDCTSLRTVPALPATRLPDACYYYMFWGSGVMLSDEKGVFDGICYGIPYRIPEEGEGTGDRDCMYSMFYGTSGPFKGTPDLNTTYYLAVPVPAASISLNRSSFTLFENKAGKLTAAILPADATFGSPHWTSDRPDIASVDQKGNIKALDVGTATITASATDGTDLSAECVVTVRPAVTGIAMPSMKTKGKTAITIAWMKVEGADGYEIYLAKCNKKDNKSSCKKVKTIKGNKTFSWTKKKLKKATKYKAYVKAYVKANGKKTYVNTSPLMHIFTSGGDKKYTNAKAVKVNKTKVSLKKGKTFQVKAKAVKLNKKKKLMPKSHVATIRYLSTDRKVATVSKSGKITAKGTGTCRIYVYAHNGVNKKITVTVK